MGNETLARGETICNFETSQFDFWLGGSRVRCVNMEDFLVSRDIKIYSNGKGLGRVIFTDANDCLELMVIHIFLS